MRVALFSPFSSQNYGTVLQAFALSKVLSNLGAESEYIGWRHCEPSMKHRVRFLIKHPTYFFLYKKNKENNKDDLHYSFLSEDEYQGTIIKNKEFVKNYTPVNSRLYTYDELASIESLYDKIIVGSDQTWSPDHLYQFSPYYLPFIKNRKKKFAYACSMGRTTLPTQFVAYLKERLKSFESLSCREKENAEILSKLLGKKVYHVVDPTLLLCNEDWNNYMLPVENMPPKYIVCYILGEKKSVSDYAEFLGKRKNLPVYYILTRPSHAHHKNVLKGIGVQEFLWLINNCQYLVTDSFHGTIFAMNLGKEMISFDKFEGNMYDNGRIENVLTHYGIGMHYMRIYEERIPEEINYLDVYRLIEKDRQESMSYLKSIIQ